MSPEPDITERRAGGRADDPGRGEPASWAAGSGPQLTSGPPPVVLSLAAQDPLGGAGSAADLTTFAAFGVHGVSVTTALTAQSLTEMTQVETTDAGLIARQIDGILADFAPAAVKTGLIASPETASLVAALVGDGRLPPPVVDPVLVNGRGEQFAAPEVEAAYRAELIPAAQVITPNVDEAQILIGRPLETLDAVVDAAADLAALGAAWTVVTGRSWEHSSDVLVGPDGSVEVIEGPALRTRHVRGSGCTFAAALAAGLACGRGTVEAVTDAKRFVHDCLARTPDWPVSGAGPVAHWR